MDVSPPTTEEICNALLSAFPTQAALGTFVRIKYDMPLDRIAGGENLEDIVLDLMEWARARKGLLDLVTRAHERVPDNPDLKDLLPRLQRERLQRAPNPEDERKVFSSEGIPGARNQQLLREAHENYAPPGNLPAQNIRRSGAVAGDEVDSPVSIARSRLKKLRRHQDALYRCIQLLIASDVAAEKYNDIQHEVESLESAADEKELDAVGRKIRDYLNEVRRESLVSLRDQTVLDDSDRPRDFGLELADIEELGRNAREFIDYYEQIWEIGEDAARWRQAWLVDRRWVLALFSRAEQVAVDLAVGYKRIAQENLMPRLKAIAEEIFEEIEKQPASIQTSTNDNRRFVLSHREHDRRLERLRPRRTEAL